MRGRLCALSLIGCVQQILCGTGSHARAPRVERRGAQVPQVAAVKGQRNAIVTYSERLQWPQESFVGAIRAVEGGGKLQFI